MCIRDRPIPLFGDGTTRRDYTYIDDIIQGVLQCVDTPFDYEIFNLGENHTTSLAELIRQIVTWYEVKITRTVGRYIFLDIGQEAIYWQLLALAVLVFLVGWLIGRSRLGLALRVIGDDETVARHVAIDTTAAKLILFAASAAFMSVAGAVMAPRWTYIEPSIAFNPTISFQVVIMALLGGAHRLWGPAVGAIPLTLLFEFLSARFPSTSTLIIGIVFLLIVYALPQGVTGLWERVSRRKSEPPVVPQVQT